MTGTLNDGLNENQLNGRDVSLEDVDQKGMVKRQKINDQTIFDFMFIQGFITMAHHEAVHLFIEDLSQSGTSIKSVDVEAFGSGAFHKKGDAMAERRMIFSDAFRSMHDSADEPDVKLIMTYCNNPYRFNRREADCMALADTMQPCLTALAKHYGVISHRDPRSILRSQVYSA
jgi:hypothetical protein